MTDKASLDVLLYRYSICARYMNDQSEESWIRLCDTVLLDVKKRIEERRCRLCLDVPGKDGLGRPCKGCRGTGWRTPP
jgi:hypothetical protein